MPDNLLRIRDLGQAGARSVLALAGRLWPAPEGLAGPEVLASAGLGALASAGLKEHGAAGGQGETVPGPKPNPEGNSGREADDPLAALAGLLAASRVEPDLARLRVAWLGGSMAEANAWVELAMYFPFELFMALTSDAEPDRERLALAMQVGAKIFLTDEPRLALDGSHWGNQPPARTFEGDDKDRALAAVRAAVRAVMAAEEKA